MATNYWAILVCGVLAMVLGMIWYGPLFGKTWARIVGATDMDEAKRKEMQKKAGPLYVVQFALVLLQLFVLSHLTGLTAIEGIESALWVWVGFVMPTVAGSSMWNNDSGKISWTRFLVQAGYQLVCLVAFGAILGAWH
jgi:hypothetical protein